MSVFDFPRIHFSGIMRVNVGTGNNDDYSSSPEESPNNYLFADTHKHLRTFDSVDVELTGCPVMSPKKYIEWMKKDQPGFVHNVSGDPKNPDYQPASVTPAYWNYFGSMSVWADGVNVDGVTLAPGNKKTAFDPTDPAFVQRLLGSANKANFSYYRWPHPPNTGVIAGDDKAQADVKTTAVMTDVKSEGSSPGSQIFADNFLLRDSDGAPLFYRSTGEQGTYAGSGSKPTKASATRLNAGSGGYECFYAGTSSINGAMVANPGGAAVFQCVMPFSDDFIDDGYRDFVAEHANAALGEVKGIIVSYVMSAGIHPLNSSPEWAELYDQDPQTSFFDMLNERQCPVSGLIAPWYGEDAELPTPDLSSITVGRQINVLPGIAQKTPGWTDGPPALPLTLSPMIARLQSYTHPVSGGAPVRVLSVEISKALTSYFTGVAGNLSLMLSSILPHIPPFKLADLPYGNPENDQYIDLNTHKINQDPSTFVFKTPQEGIIDVVLDEQVYGFLNGIDPAYPDGGILSVETDSDQFQVGDNQTQVLFQETTFGIINNQRALYAEEALPGEPTTQSLFRSEGAELVESVFQITRKGSVMTELPTEESFVMLYCETVPLPTAYSNPVYQSPINTMDDLRVTADVTKRGNWRFAVVPASEAGNYKTFGDLDNSPMVVAQVRVLPNEDYSKFYVDPTASEPVGNELLTFEVIYEKVLKPYHVLYPAMDQVRSLGDPEEWGGSDTARRLLDRVNPAGFGESKYMPRTRDLSGSRRQLIEAWCRKTLTAGQQENPPA